MRAYAKFGITLHLLKPKVSRGEEGHLTTQEK